jgi:tRNA (guanine37-N1)-methyltransferase
MAMKFSVITLFPEMITPIVEASILGRAQSAGHIAVETINPRDFTDNAWHKVDDAPYGGGSGMVMQCDPVMKAYESLLPLPEKTRTFLMTPVGLPFVQSEACAIAQDVSQVVLICGHYEGIDARILELIPKLEPLCVSDVVVTGGELPALMVLDAIARHVPGVLGKTDSAQEESFMAGLLEHPHYTRPQMYRGLSVPDVLLSGNHQAIADWRQAERLRLTQQYRPDLLF